MNDGSLYVFISLYPILFPLTSQYVYIGALGGLLSLFSVALSPFLGRFADRRRNYGTLLFLGLCLLGIGIIGYGIFSRLASGESLFIFLIPFSIIAGLGSAFYHPLGGTVLHSTWDSRSIGRAMGINGSSGSVGRAVYPLIVAALVIYLTTLSVIALAFLAFGAAFVVLNILKNVNLFGAAKTEDKVNQKNTQIPIKKILPLILPLTIVSFLKGVFSIGIVNFILVFLKHNSGLDYGLSLIVFALILTMPIAGQIVFGFIADKHGRRLALGITTTGSGAAILIVLTTSNLYIQVACFAIFGFFALTGFPLLLPLASSAVPKEATTFSNSIVWGIGNVGGGALGPTLIGILAQFIFHESLGDAFFVVTIISLSSLTVLPFVATKPKILS